MEKIREVVLDASAPGSGMDDEAEISLSIEMGDSTSAATAEAYAIGKRKGVDVTEDDPTYHNNAKYYAEQGGSLVGECEDIRDEAAAAKAGAETAQAAAERAQGIAETEVAKLTGLTVSAEESTEPAATISEVDGHLNILFELVKGDKGDTGDKGDKGDPGEETVLTPVLIDGTDYKLVVERA